MMTLKLIEPLGDGAHADVWKGEDALRKVAVKIVRPSAGGVANTIEQAQALARAAHPNIVDVYYVSKVTDPMSNKEVDCVVMELIEGSTLSKRLKGDKFTLSELKVTGGGMINGLEHIHNQNMVHGDLHEENVMLYTGGVKIIDILYRKTLAAFPTAPRQTIIRQDLLSLRLLLQNIILHSELDPGEAAAFNNLLIGDVDFAKIRGAFNEVTDARVFENLNRLEEDAFRRLIDEGFIEGPNYASALSDETPRGITARLLNRIFAENIYRREHAEYIKILWARLSPEEKAEVLKTLGAAIDAQTPAGVWWPPLNALHLLGEEGWRGLSKLTRIRLGQSIVNDILLGRYKYTKNETHGVLGTYATMFYPYFEANNLNQLVDNIIALLRQDWDRQNYIGKYFMEHLDRIATLTSRQDELTEALAGAVHKNAIHIKTNLKALPRDWATSIYSLARTIS